ncbi:hypothetical protein [Companilactobacillus heilongjiangensis]|uniref:Uncharacterized protein n=1 Tax=Companilactobacillus heilongjiangensis TaxID=1074467 RepID=A0A0K2LEW5_9LACO|nr:hypothetical protein [Companilactobacillus heilongjiangensis]ALB29846.1 hypothetical protein JP39_11055 [Companilactobacillus heilongjiangensis]
MDTSNFKVYSLSNGLPTMTVAKSGISFSRTAVIRLNKPKYAELLMDVEKKAILIKPSEESNPDAAPFYKEDRKLVMARWNYKDLIQRFEEMMSWNTDEHTYKIEGKYFMEDNELLFNLNEAQTIK